MTFRIARSIFVALLAVAIATPPMVVGTARAASPAATVVATVEPSSDCDHYRRDAPSEQTHDTVKHDTCAVGCTLCFVFVGADTSVAAYSISFSTALKPARVLNRLSSLMGSPPFRPPRA
ncbi:MAG TPA: hypothetical protein VJZ74_02490 [Pseudolabrys sp.]|nr:hypothetical protein [Pseudolabrys sp.]